ncbi:MAG TPA: DUF4384 domain-containing protein [Blastocatellia bacterium]|nr:DUF4384 domain-containing protein [Blastocatellia bacterium]
MKRIFVLFVYSMLAISASGAYLEVAAQDQIADRTREAFLFSREKAPAKGKVVRRKRRNAGSVKGDPAETKIEGAVLSSAFAPGSQTTAWKDLPTAAYTLFKQSGDGTWANAESSEVFQKGEVLRFIVESMEDGYLYVFNTTNGQDPQMVYPHPSLNRGANRIRAHIPYEIPSRDNPDFSGFELADRGVNEEVWLVITKTPLTSIPTDQTLLNFCRGPEADCPWQPSAALWQRLAAYEKSTMTVDSRPTETAALSGALEKAITRHIRLKPKARRTEPSVIFRRQSGIEDPLALKISLMVR